MTTTTSGTPDTTTIDSTVPAHPGRLRLVAGAIATSAVTIATLVLTHPWGERLDSSSDTVLSYDAQLPYRDDAWLALLVDVLAYGVLMVGLAIGVCHLVRGRGARTATVGGVLAVAGGLLFAMGGMALASLVWFGTGLPEEQARAFIDYANDHAGRLIGVEAAGFLLTTLASFVLAAALFRARAVPRLAIAVFVVLTAALFLGLPGQAMNAVQAAQVLVLGALAVPLWTRAAGEAC